MVVESGTARYLKVSRGGRINICPHRPGFESGADPRDDGALAGLGIFSFQNRGGRWIFPRS